MKKILALLILFLTIGCKERKIYHTDKIYLRQLANNDESQSKSYSSFFLVTGEMTSETKTQTVVKVIGSVDNEYRFMKFDFEDIRIKIDNKAIQPYIVINYVNREPLTVNELLYSYIHEPYKICNITIVCAQQYLPQKLLPIQI
jgi:hypothetical protein